VKRLVPLVILTILLVGSVLLGLSCTPQTTLGISITELDNGVFIENVSNVDCLVFVTPLLLPRVGTDIDIVNTSWEVTK
jgi:hypothetical protein